MNDSTEAFAARIRERFPEGLTGVFAVGGTRTSYILETQRQQNDIGNIDDFQDYANLGFDKYLELISLFRAYGGKHAIISPLSFQSFYERGPDYAALISRYTLYLIDEKSLSFYHHHRLAPYFAGIDTLLKLSSDHPGHELGAKLAEFQTQHSFPAEWGRLVWEIAPIPLYTFWKASREFWNDPQLVERLESETDLYALHDELYRLYSKAAYGQALPMPHFYVGSSRNGDLKPRSMFPLAMSCGGPMRLFYLPYPSLLMTADTLREILENLAFGKPVLHSRRVDYTGQVTRELAEAEYNHYLTLAADPQTTLGLYRSMNPSDGQQT